MAHRHFAGSRFVSIMARRYAAQMRRKLAPSPLAAPRVAKLPIAAARAPRTLPTAASILCALAASLVASCGKTEPTAVRGEASGATPSSSVGATPSSALAVATTSAPTSPPTTHASASSSASAAKSVVATSASAVGCKGTLHVEPHIEPIPENFYMGGGAPATIGWNSPGDRPGSIGTIGIGASSAPPPPTVSVTEGACTASGAIGHDDVCGELHRGLWRIRACYQKALAIDPTEKGSVGVALQLDDSGEVVSSSASSATVKNASLTQCIVGAMRNHQFKPPASAGPTTATYAVILSTG